MHLCRTQIQGLIAITHDDYSPQPYQGYLFVIAMVSLGLLINTWGAKHLPLVEGVILIFHVFGFATVLIVLWVLSPRNTVSEVFTSFENSGGWSSMALSMLVGQVTSIYGLIGSDGAAHMAEETRDASIIVPRCMIWSYLLNGAMGFVMIVTFCMMIGDVETALDSPTGYAFIDVFYNATHSKAGTSVMVALFIIMLLFGCVTNFATSSRQLWAFVS